MPGHRLQRNEQSSLERFSVVGKYARPDQDDFVQHVALLRDDCELEFSSEVDVWHTAPPIVAGGRTSQAASNEQQRCAVHAVSYLEDLSAEEVAGIETTLAEIDHQTQPVRPPLGLLAQYVVHPPVQWVMDRTTGTKRFRRFSCVGFVQECYDAGAGIPLLDLAADMPPVDLATLVATYGDQIGNVRLRKYLGIHGSEPWPIALAGYLMHALSKPAEQVRGSPHVPSSVDEARFPLDDHGHVDNQED